MDATIYHNANCGTSRTVLDLLRSAGAEVRVVDYLADPPSAAELARLYAAAGLTPAQGLRAREPAAAALGEASDDAILAAMAAHPVLIERPLVESDRGVRLCRPATRVHEIL
ncbi:MAG TPA: arsenate reductase family protein [Sphingomonadaceae bacterium]|nr:arsenate reductase family protein [Sphingomonadaceae bacterium]